MKVNNKIQEKLSSYFKSGEEMYPALDKRVDLDIQYEGVTFPYIKKYVLEEEFNDDTEILANLYYFCLTDPDELGFLFCPCINKIVFNRQHDGWLKCIPISDVEIEYGHDYDNNEIEKVHDFGELFLNSYKQYFNDN